MTLTQINLEKKSSLQVYAEECIKAFDDNVYIKIVSSDTRIVYKLTNNITYYVVYYVKNNEFCGSVLSEDRYNKIFGI